MRTSDTNSSAAYAAELAREAGRLLSELQASADSDELGTPGLKNRGDRLAQRYLDERLRRDHPQDSILSEEAPDSSERLSARRVWIIDPLDGTREFSEGRKDWAVHVALWENGELTAGAVALPGLDTVLSSEDTAATVPDPGALRLAVSRSRSPRIVDQLADRLGAQLVPMGSAGFKAMAVVRGEVDAYVHAGGQYEWDSAAPVIVARSAGLFTSRIDGSPLEYNQPNPYLPDLLVCTPARADELLDAIGEYLREDAHG